MRFDESRRRCRSASVPLACTLLFAACGGGGTEPVATTTTGAIEVAVSMTGANLPSAYSVSVANRLVSADRTRVAVIAGLEPGTHTVLLRLLSNCQVADENPRAVTVVAGETTAVTFSVTCAAATGVLRVTTVTTGVDLDPDGYWVRVDGFTVEGKRYDQSSSLDANGTRTLSGVPIGSGRVTLSGLSLNCDPADASQRTVSVPSADTVAVAFTISCGRNDGQLAFVVGLAPAIRHIYVANLNGIGVRRFTDVDLSSDEDPAWSRDGKKLAFTTDRNGNQEIYVADADGSTVVRLTNDPAADYEPAWSPDGTRIAFVSKRAGAADIFTMNVDGTNVTRLTTTPGVDTDPAWSPDGRIAFTSDRDGLSDIYVMNADGSEARRLTTTGGSHPAWSPDGARLAYSSGYCPFSYCAPSIYITSGSEVAPANFGPAQRPAWSPDGRKIAFNGLDCDFYYITCDPGSVRIARLANTDVIPVASGFNPAWRP